MVEHLLSKYDKLCASLKLSIIKELNILIVYPISLNILLYFGEKVYFIVILTDIVVLHSMMHRKAGQRAELGPLFHMQRVVQLQLLI